MPVAPVLVEDQPLLVEIEDRNVPVPPVAEGGFESAETAIQHATDLGEFIQRACIQLYGSVRKAADTVKPDHIEVTFGVKLGGEAGVPFVAKGTAEANVAITLSWSPAQKTEVRDGNTEARDGNEVQAGGGPDV